MLSILLVAAAVALFYGGDLSKFQPAVEWVKRLDPKKWVAIALVLAAVLLMPRGQRQDEPTPAPDTGPLVLRGTFLGPSASDDASLVGALCHELAACLCKPRLRQLAEELLRAVRVRQVTEVILDAIREPSDVSAHHRAKHSGEHDKRDGRPRPTRLTSLRHWRPSRCPCRPRPRPHVSLASEPRHRCLRVRRGTWR